MIKLYRFIFILLISCSFVKAQKGYNNLIYEGNQQFEKKNFDQSSAQFMEAAQLKQNDFIAHYNLANALYKGKQIDQAIEEYKKAIHFAKTPTDKTLANYNLGNALMQSHQPEKAADYYKKALQLDPYNDKVRKNYEIAKLNIQKQEQKKQNNQQNQQQKQNDSTKNQQASQDGRKPKDDPSDKSAKENGGIGNKEHQQAQEKSDSHLPKDLEKQLLDGVKEKEAETARRILNTKTNITPYSKEKDW